MLKLHWARLETYVKELSKRTNLRESWAETAVERAHESGGMDR